MVIPASSDAQPVEGARVSIRTTRQRRLLERLHGQGRHRGRPSRTALRDPERSGRLRFLVTAERRTATSPTWASDWHGRYRALDLRQLRIDLERGAAAAARIRVQRPRASTSLGEEVHFKAILRSDTAKGIGLLPTGAPRSRCRSADSQDDERDKRTVLARRNGAARTGPTTLPDDAPPGPLLRCTATVADRSPHVVRSRPRRRLPASRLPRGREPRGRVARWPGPRLSGVVNGRYLFGARHGRPRRALDVLARSRSSTVPSAVVTEALPPDRYCVPERGC